MKVLVTGANGQLAYAVRARLAATCEVVALTRDDLDIARYGDVADTVQRIRPDVIVNGAAYNDVDGAEDDAPTAMAVNAFGVRALSRAASEIDATLVHFSTDFVFDGTADHAYTEEIRPNPQSVYAISKLLGEWFARESKHYVLRVESLFGGGLQTDAGDGPRGSSLDRIADAILEGRDVRAFQDRTVSPSYVDDVAATTESLLEMSAPWGLYHCVGSGMATWLELATELTRRLERRARIIPVTMSSVALKAKRPRFCALSNAKLSALGITMPSWEDALGRYARGRLAQL